MIQFGNGFSMMELYNMPTYLRLFYYNKLVEVKRKENEQIESNKKSSKVRITR